MFFPLLTIWNILTHFLTHWAHKSRHDYLKAEGECLKLNDINQTVVHIVPPDIFPDTQRLSNMTSAVGKRMHNSPKIGTRTPQTTPSNKATDHAMTWWIECTNETARAAGKQLSIVTLRSGVLLKLELHKRNDCWSARIGHQEIFQMWSREIISLINAAEFSWRQRWLHFACVSDRWYSWLFDE